MATVWMVLRMATESALRIKASISADDGSLTKRLSTDLTKVPTLLATALLMTPPATTLLLTTAEEAPDKAARSAFGKFPSVITLPEAMLDAPVLVEVTKTAPVPMFDRPVPDDSPRPPAESPPMLVTARSETPVNLAP